MPELPLLIAVFAIGAFAGYDSRATLLAHAPKGVAGTEWLIFG